jgi:hypothetical protein
VRLQPPSGGNLGVCLIGPTGIGTRRPAGEIKNDAEGVVVVVTRSAGPAFYIGLEFHRMTRWRTLTGARTVSVRLRCANTRRSQTVVDRNGRIDPDA